MEKSGKQHCVRDVAENVAVEPVVATLKKEIAKGQRQTELSVNASPLKTKIKSCHPSDQPLTKNATCQKEIKIKRSVPKPSMLFLHIFFFLCKIFMILKISDCNYY